MMRRAIAIALALGLAACSSSGSEPPGQAVPEEAALRLPTLANGSTDGVATGFELLPHPNDPSHPVAPPGALVLDRCRWRGPGLMTYDLEWHPSGQVSFPVTFEVSLERYAGDVGTGIAGNVTLQAAGSFSVTENANEGPRDRWDGQRFQWGDETAQSCDASAVGTQARFTGEVKPVVDILQDGLTAPAGSVEGLARGVDLANENDPLLPLGFLLAKSGLPAIDRLYIAAHASMSAISVELDGTCLTVTSAYAGEPPIQVIQRLRCQQPDRSGDQRIVGIVDDVWDVEVSGSRAAVDGFIADKLEVWRFAAVEPFAAAAGEFDPDASIDAIVRDRGLLEIARFDWQGGRVAAIARHESNCCENYSDPIVATPEVFGGGGSSEDCRDYSIDIADDGERGFVLIVTQQPGFHVSVAAPDGTTVDVALTPAAGEREAALFDIAGGTESQVSDVTITDGAGKPVPCDQS